MTPLEATDKILEWAAQAGLVRAGVAAAGPLERQPYIEDWLARGWAGEMTYLARHRDLRADPRRLLPGARSVIVVADLYCQPSEPSPGESPGGEPRGRVARYAWGRDYHRVLRKKLHALADRMHAALEGPFETRVCVDTAPTVEREWAAAAGVGWIAKNTMVLDAGIGSFFFLGEILTTLELAPTPPAVDHCGTCTRCLDACPTGALVAPYQMDARRCISYLTIEHRSDIDPELRPQVGDWLYGCDVCQDVCPYNRKPPETADPAYAAGGRNPLPPTVPLKVIQEWSEEEYDNHLAGSAMRRASLSMLKRNADVIAENMKRPRAD